MADVRFEPFGESVEDSEILNAPQDDFSRRFERLGMGVFWVLVSVVVVARALYFDPDFGARFGKGVVHVVEALLGAMSIS
jgi:ABC-type polysaccharide/polyol phosphate export permease